MSKRFDIPDSAPPRRGQPGRRGPALLSLEAQDVRYKKGNGARCGGGSSTSSSSKVLKVWWYESPGSAYYIAWNQAIKDFKKAHPGVKVEFSVKSFNQMQQ